MQHTSSIMDSCTGSHAIESPSDNILFFLAIVNMSQITVTMRIYYYIIMYLESWLLTDRFHVNFVRYNVIFSQCLHVCNYLLTKNI